MQLLFREWSSVSLQPVVYGRVWLRTRCSMTKWRYSGVPCQRSDWKCNFEERKDGGHLGFSLVPAKKSKEIVHKEITPMKEISVVICDPNLIFLRRSASMLNLMWLSLIMYEKSPHL